MELREYARAARHHWLLILAAVGLSVGTTAMLTGLASPAYRSSTVLFVSPDTTNVNPDVLAQRAQSY